MSVAAELDLDRYCADVAARAKRASVKLAITPTAIKNDWLRKSAEQGCPDGQYYLGTMFETGRGVPKSLDDALRWYRLAAAQGHANAAKRVKALTGQP